MKNLPPDFFSAQVSQARRFYFNLKPSPKTKLAVVCGGVEHCAPDYAVVRKSFPFYSVEFVAQGDGRLKLNGSEHRLQPGIVFTYGPEIAHDISNQSHGPLIKYFIDFTGSDATRFLKCSKLKPGTISKVFPPAAIQPILDEIIRNGLRGAPRSREICVKLLEALLLKIHDARTPLLGHDSFAFSTYQQCRVHIEQNFLRLRSLKQVAAECHVDVAYLCRLFQRYDHQTPYGTLTRLKMNYAAEQLQSCNATVKQIAGKTGFANQFHFSRVFKSVFGLSPRLLIKIRQ